VVVSFLVLVVWSVVSVVVMATGTGLLLLGGDLLEVCSGGGELDGGEGVPDNVHGRIVCRGCRGNISCWRGVADDVAVLHGRLCKRLCYLLHGDGRDANGQPDSFRSRGDFVCAAINRGSEKFRPLGRPTKMTEDALLALQRHFEEQYGKLEMPGTRKKKRKRTEEEERPEEKVADSEDEWGGIQDDSVLQQDPKVVEYKDTTSIDEVDTKSYKSFMVIHVVCFG
jgi:hypothetical protein